MRTATRSTPEGLALAVRLARTRAQLSGGALAVAAVWPAAHAEDGPVVCPFRLLTGLPCPACGLTRSFVYTLHGRLGDAFAAHAFGPALVVLAAVWLVLGRRAAGSWADPARWTDGRARPWALAVGGLWLLYAVGRLLATA